MEEAGVQHVNNEVNMKAVEQTLWSDSVSQTKMHEGELYINLALYLMLDCTCSC